MTSHVYRGIVLSGGGARGPYGAGMLAALRAHDKLKGSDPLSYYVGSSVGSLSATLSAQGDLSKLLQLYSNKKTRDIIGVRNPDFSKPRLVRRALGFKRKVGNGKRSFSYYKNTKLREIIGKYVDYTKLTNANANLLITATNFETGDTETFYLSSVVDQHVKEDESVGRSEGVGRRRLHDYHRIDSQEMLINVLVASAAVPFYFPPVLVGKHLYIDGGVGNNTPTRQAAYFYRFLDRLSQGTCEAVFCSVLTPTRLHYSGSNVLTIPDIVERTIDLFQGVITRSMLRSWHQISDNVEAFEQRKRIVLDQLEKTSSLSHTDRIALRSSIEALSPSEGSTPRLSVPLVVVRPSRQLSLTNIFDFDPSKAKHAIEDGYADTVSQLRANNYIDAAEEEKLKNAPIV